jgi:hypothetical protein
MLCAPPSATVPSPEHPACRHRLHGGRTGRRPPVVAVAVTDVQREERAFWIPGQIRVRMRWAVASARVCLATARLATG